MGREIDLVDHQEIGARDAGAALGGNLVAGGDVDDIDRQVGKLGRKSGSEIVTARFDQHQIERGKFLPHVGDGREIGGSILADRGVRAAAGLDADLAKYLPLWKLAVPVEFENVHHWDFSKFGRGERFVYQAIPRAEFDEVLDQVKRWGLDQYLKDRSFEHLAADLSGLR